MRPRLASQGDSWSEVEGEENKRKIEMIKLLSVDKFYETTNERIPLLLHLLFYRRLLAFTNTLTQRGSWHVGVDPNVPFSVTFYLQIWKVIFKFEMPSSIDFCQEAGPPADSLFILFGSGTLNRPRLLLALVLVLVPFSSLPLGWCCCPCCCDCCCVARLILLLLLINICEWWC